MHDSQSSERNLCHGRRFCDEPCEHSRTAFSCFIEQEAIAFIASRHGFGKNLTFLKLEHGFDASQ